MASFNFGIVDSFLGQVHIKDLGVKEDMVLGLGDNFCNFLSVLDFPDIEIG